MIRHPRARRRLPGATSGPSARRTLRQTLTMLTAALVVAALAPLAATAAQATTPTPPVGIGVLVTDEAGNPLNAIQYDLLEYRPVEGDWYGTQRGPNLTDETGHMWEDTVVGSTYKLCFSDDYYSLNDDWYQPELRYGDACVGGGTSFDDAATFTVTAQDPVQQVTITLPLVGRSLRPVEPFVVGSTAAGGTLTVQTGTWKPAGVALTYQWVTWTDGHRTALPNGTGAAFTPTADLVGQTLYVEVTGMLAGYRTATVQGWAGAVGIPTPTVSQPLALAGTAVVGATLTATFGTVTPAGTTPMFQWLVDGYPAPGTGTSSQTTFPLTAEHVGARITARMSLYGNDGGLLQASATSAVVQATVSLTAPVPTIIGTTTVGRVLTAVPGTWGPAPVALAYQWYRSGTAIAGATASTYTLTTADQGRALAVHVVGRKADYPTVERSSAATAVVAGLLTSPTPTVSGTVRVGQTLTAVPGTWGPAPVTLAYQWYRAGIAVSGATAATYTLTTADQGKTLAVHVVGRKTGYATVDKASASTVAVAGLLTSTTPTVSGTLRVGYTLTATPGTWGPAPVTLTYQWYRSGVAISGATSPTYKLVTADKGTGIRVKVTGAKTGYTSIARYSVQTAAIG